MLVSKSYQHSDQESLSLLAMVVDPRVDPGERMHKAAGGYSGS